MANASREPTQSAAFGDLTKRDLRKILGIPRQSAIVASAPLAVRAKFEGRRGSSVWQRKRLLSDVLVAMLSDLEASADRGLDAPILHELSEAAKVVSSALRSIPARDIVEPLADVVGQFSATIQQLEPIHGNGPAKFARLRVLGDFRARRRQAASVTRSSKAFGSIATPLSPIDSAIAKVAQIAESHPKQLPRLRQAVHRYWRRRGAIALDPAIAQEVQQLLPAPVFESVQRFLGGRSGLRDDQAQITRGEAELEA